MNKMTMAELRQLIIDLMDPRAYWVEFEYDEKGNLTGGYEIMKF